MKKHKHFCTRNDRNFKKNVLLMKDAKLVINGKTRTRFTFLKTFREDFVTGVSHRMIWTVLKTDSGHVALLADNFFSYKQSWEILFLLEEDYYPIPSSEIRDVYGDFHEWTKACIFQETSFWIASYEMSFWIL